MKMSGAPSLFLLICVSAFLVGCNQSGKTQDAKNIPKFSTEFQAVFMDNGQIFFGKLEQAGADYPLLKDVFYVQNQVNQETKEVKNILVKRGQEWHAPDYMYVNAHHILAIEPVSPSSQLARLIQQAGKIGRAHV